MDQLSFSDAEHQGKRKRTRREIFLNQAGNLLHGNEEYVFGDAGYRGIEKREEFQYSETEWFIAEPPGKIRSMKRRGNKAEKMKRQVEKSKAGIRARSSTRLGSSSASSDLPKRVTKG